MEFPHWRHLCQSLSRAGHEISLGARESARCTSDLWQLPTGTTARSAAPKTELSLAERGRTGIEQVYIAITHIDRGTQSNSAQTQELSATEQALSEQAGNQLDRVRTLTLDNGDRNQGNGRGDSCRTGAQCAHIDPAPRHPGKAVRSGAPPKADGFARVRNATIRSAAPDVAAAASTESSDASFQAF